MQRGHIYSGAHASIIEQSHTHQQKIATRQYTHTGDKINTNTKGKERERDVNIRTTEYAPQHIVTTTPPLLKHMSKQTQWADKLLLHNSKKWKATAYIWDGDATFGR